MRRKDRKEMIVDDELETQELSSACLDATKDIVISLSSGLPDRKYAKLDESFQGFYKPTNVMRKKLYESFDVHNSLVRIDGMDYQIGILNQSEVNRLTTMDYQIRFLQQSYIMDDVYNKIEVDMPEDIRVMAMEQLILLKRKFPDASPNDIAALFYLFICWYDPEFQLYDNRFHQQIMEMIPRLGTIFTDFDASYGFIRHLLKYEFHIYASKDTEEIVSDVYFYITTYILTRLSKRFPYLSFSFESEYFIFLSPLIRINDILLLKQNPLPLERLYVSSPSSSPSSQSDSQSASPSSQDASQSASPSSQDASQTSPSAIPSQSASPSSQDARSPSPTNSTSSSINALFEDEKQGKKGKRVQRGRSCVICGKGKKIIPTYDLKNKMKTFICESCVSKNKLQM